MFIVSNNAPDGSPLALKDMEATLTLPDGLIEAKTTTRIIFVKIAMGIVLNIMTARFQKAPRSSRQVQQVF